MSDIKRPPVVGIRELSRDYGAVFDRLHRDREPLLVTRNKTPVAVLVPIDESRLEQFIVSTAPGIAEAFADAETAVDEGRTWSTDELLTEFGEEPGAAAPAAELSAAPLDDRLVSIVEMAVERAVQRVLGPAAAAAPPPAAIGTAPTGPSLSAMLAGKSVLITGATSGMGAAMATRIARAGGIPLLVARGEEKLRELRDKLVHDGFKAHAYSADVSDHDSVDELVARLTSEHAAIDVVVHNAGRSIRRAIASSHDRFQDFERTIALNYLAAVRLTLGLLPRMRERGDGHIINVSSLAVQLHPPGYSAFVASKAAFDAWTRVAAAEIGGDGVRFTTVHMPVVRTAMIAPPKPGNASPPFSPGEAADLVCEAIRTRAGEIGTPLGVLAELASAAVPTATGFLLAAAGLRAETSVHVGDVAADEASPGSGGVAAI